MVQSKTPKITNFGLWDFKKFFVEHTVPNDVIFLNPHQAPEVSKKPLVKHSTAIVGN
jgi:hypothetical protein